jgi:hypothetical protein
MALNYTITDDFKVILKDGTKKVDEVGAFDSLDSAEYWGVEVCAKYNSPEYAKVKYPNELPDETKTS